MTQLQDIGEDPSTEPAICLCELQVAGDAGAALASSPKAPPEATIQLNTSWAGTVHHTQIQGVQP